MCLTKLRKELQKSRREPMRKERPSGFCLCGSTFFDFVVQVCKITQRTPNDLLQLSAS